MKKLLIAALTFLSSLTASATTITPDYSDIWWNANESGWGANVIQQGDTLFVTLFVYNSSGQPEWYVAPQVTYAPSGATNIFTGLLYRTTGPFLGTTPFNPNAVTATQVGTLTFSSGASTPTSALLTYTVSGVNVSKAITRQHWRDETLAGQYFGGTTGNITGCLVGNGISESAASYTILQTGNQVRIDEFVSATATSTPYTCTYNGTYTQTGRLGTITGTGTCSTTNVGQTFTASEVEVGSNYFAARVSILLAPQTCTFTGRIGGVRKMSQ